MKRIAIFPGSFDPFTKGHADIAKRSLLLFDELLIAVGVNSEKKSSASHSERVNSIASLFETEDRIRVISYTGLTAEKAKEEGVCCIIRGIRNEEDASYEKMIAVANYKVFDLETIFLLAEPKLAQLSSTVVRELKALGKDVSGLLPE